MLILKILAIIGLSLLLIKAADILVFHLRSLGKKISLPGFFLASIIIGLATSLPELFIGIASSIEGIPNISLGNVIGSNIADLSLVAGLAAILGGDLKIRRRSSFSDLFYAFLAGSAPLVLLWDKNLSRIDGLILIFLYGFYNFLILNKRKKYLDDGDGVISGLIRRIRRNNTGKDFMFVFLGLVLLLFSSDMIVIITRSIASDINISILLVGLFLVAVGTSLPELIFELKAVKKNESEMFMGNLLGSIVANGTLVIGITAFITPIRILAFSEYILATVFFIFIFCLFYFFLKTKKSLQRWEGAVLLFVYFIFFILEIM